MRNKVGLVVFFVALSYSVLAANITWVGSVGSVLPWEDGINWSGAQVPASGDVVGIDNGGGVVLSGVASSGTLNASHGALSITGGGRLEIDGDTTSRIGRYAGNEFSLNLEHGLLKVGAGGNIFCGTDGGLASIVIGGSGESAVLDVGRDLVVSHAGQGSMVVGDGGSVRVGTGWFYVAVGNNSHGELVVGEGGVCSSGGGANLFVMLRDKSAESLVRLDGGEIDFTGDLMMMRDNADNSTSTLQLDSGVLRVLSIATHQTANSSSTIYMNGATIEARSSHGEFIKGVSAAYIQSGGVVFDIPYGVTVDVPQALLDANSGVFVKRGGGVLKLSGANTFTGDIEVEEGFLFLDNGDALVAGYAGSIAVAGGAGIGYNVSGGATTLLGLIDVESKGYLLIGESDAESTIDFTAHPDMKMAYFDYAGFAGVITPEPLVYTIIVSGGSVADLTDVIGDSGGNAVGVEIIASGGGGINIYGASSYTGTTVIDGADVRLENASALGSGGAITLRNGGALRLNATMDVGALVARLTSDSEGGLLVGPNNANANIDLSGWGSVMVGTAETDLIYGGVITPAGQRYLLGGGNTRYISTPNHGITFDNLTDINGLPTEVVIGASGMVELRSGNSYSGGTIVTNRGVLFLVEDGLGAIPATPDPSNLYVDNGVIRSGMGKFELHENRGVSVGPGGMELHPWSNHSMSFNGDLSGSGNIVMTDGGNIIFAGGNNTYSGEVSVRSNSRLHIGNGAVYSWSDSAKLGVSGTLYLNSDNNNTLPLNFLGGGALRKQGSGVLTVNSHSLFEGMTFVDSGEIHFGEDVSQYGDVTLGYFGGLSFESDDLNIRSLHGEGAVSGSSGATLRLGLGGASGGISLAEIDPGLNIVKQGSGKQTLRLASTDEPRPSIALLGGTLSLTSGQPGLRSRYYDMTKEVSSEIGSMAGLIALIEGREPDLVGNSYEFGENFDTGSTGARFPSPYNNSDKNYFITIWDGFFRAEKAGLYQFAAMSDDSTLIYFGSDLVLNYNGPHWYGQDKAVGSITLEAGWHPITIVFQEISGGQSITVWVTPPDEDEVVLPNSMLRDGFRPVTQVLQAEQEDAELNFDAFSSGLQISDGAPVTINATLTGGGSSTELAKDGPGGLTLRSERSDYHGVLEVETELSVAAHSGLFGVPVMGAGGSTVVERSLPFVEGGLSMRFYKFNSNNPDYTVFGDYGLLMDYYEGQSPDHIESSVVVGSGLDFGRTGEKFPYPYGAGGLYKSNFDVVLSGQIYISEAGTYRFGLNSDDGSVLYIDKQLVVNSAWDKGPSDVIKSTWLAEGWHEIVIAFRQNGGGYALTVSMSDEVEGALEVVPNSILRSGVFFSGISGPSGSTLELGTSGVGFVIESESLFEGEIVAEAGAFLSKNGVGTLTLLSNNWESEASYLIGKGTLALGSGGGSGDLGIGNPVVVGAEGVLAINRSGILTLGHSLSGTGVVQLDGTGDITLSGAEEFQGIFRVNNGSLKLAGSSLDKRAGLEVWQPGSATIELSDGSGNINSLSGDGDVRIVDSSIRVVSGSEFNGEMRVEDGTLSVGSMFGGSGQIVLDNGILSIQEEIDSGELVYNGLAESVERGDAHEWSLITPALGGCKGSIYLSEEVEPTKPWVFSCFYEANNPDGEMADGFSLLLQSDERGTSAIGDTIGHILAMDGIVRSIGVCFNIYGSQNTGWVVDGERQNTVSALNGIDLTEGVEIVLGYDGEGTLTLTLTQYEKSFSMSRTEDLSAFFEEEGPVYAGMTGATGGAVANQYVRSMVFHQGSEFVLQAALEHTVVMEDGKSGVLEYKPTVAAGMQLELAGASIGDGATLRVGLDPNNLHQVGFDALIETIHFRGGQGSVVVESGSTLGLDKVVIDETGGGVVFSGALSANEGSVTIVLPLPLSRDRVLVADFSGVVWVDGVPEFIFTDSEGNLLEVKYALRSNGILYIFTSDGTIMLLR